MVENENKKPFRQLFADEHEETFQILLHDPLLFSVFILCSIRARRIIEPSPIGLNQFEFWLSEMEFEKFGLKSSQKGKITRRLNILSKLKLISKLERKIGNKKSNIYTFNSDKIIFINPEIENLLESEQGKNSVQTVTNKNVKNDKSYINKEFPVINNKWQEHSFRISNKLGLKNPSESWLKFFKSAYEHNQQGYLDTTSTFCFDAPEVRDMEKLFFWKFNQLIKGKAKNE